MKTLCLFLILTFPLLSWSKVDPPNYNFSLEAFDIFKPGSSLEEIKKKYPKAEVVDQKLESSVIKVYVAHLRYRFPVFIQVYRDKSVDFMARLPNYFLHNLFHQTLITKFGKQDSYIKREESALYIWKGAKDGIKRVYNGTCTITCFPVYYSEISLDPPKEMANYKPLLAQFDEAVSSKAANENLSMIPPKPTATASSSSTASETLSNEKK